MPIFFIPAEWLAALGALPRLSATIAMAISISMLALGLRAYRWYLLMGAALLAWAVGAMLARLMHVTGWYVSLPALVLIMPFVWPRAVSERALPLIVGFAVGCTLGGFFAFTLEAVSFWVGFGIGAAGGAALGLLAPRFSRALLFAALGAAGFVGTLGAVVRAERGLFAPGAYRDDPMIFVLVAIVLVVASMVAQAALDPEAHL